MAEGHTPGLYRMRIHDLEEQLAAANARAATALVGVHVECDTCNKDFPLDRKDFRIEGDEWLFWICPECDTERRAHVACSISIKKCAAADEVCENCASEPTCIRGECGYGSTCMAFKAKDDDPVCECGHPQYEHVNHNLGACAREGCACMEFKAKGGEQ